MFPLAFVVRSLQGHWWGFISRNYVVWPIFFLMNVFIALKGTHFLFLFEPWLSFYFNVWELSLKILDSISYLLLNFRVTHLDKFLMLPGQVFFDFGFALVDLGQLCQIVHHLISRSCHRLFQSSQLSCGQPRGVKRLIINWCQRFGLFFIQGGLSLFCATKGAVDYARAVLKFDILNIARATTKGFVCLSECYLNVMYSMHSQWTPVTSALHLCHLLRILWPVMIKPESRIYPASQS